MFMTLVSVLCLVSLCYLWDIFCAYVGCDLDIYTLDMNDSSFIFFSIISFINAFVTMCIIMR